MDRSTGMSLTYTSSNPKQRIIIMTRNIICIIGLIAAFANIIYASFLMGRMSVGHYSSIMELNVITLLTLACWATSSYTSKK